MLGRGPTTPEDSPRIDWLWPAKRAWVWVTGGSGCRRNQEAHAMRIYIIGNDGITVSSVEPSADPETPIPVLKFARVTAGWDWIRTSNTRAL